MLGIAYVALGRNAEAVDIADRISAQNPISADAWSGRFVFENVTEIYMLAGKHDVALDRLEWLLSVPSFISTRVLRADPLWDPLRNNPRFQQLLARYER